MPKRYFLDTEFLDDGENQRLVLISIALVCDDGRELYLCDTAWLGDDGKPDGSRADDWLRANVFPQLPACTCPVPPGRTVPGVGQVLWSKAVAGFPHQSTCHWCDRTDMRQMIATFIEDSSDGTKPEVWAYFASYDWVLFCQLFGKMINLPKHFPWLVNDLKVWATHMGYTGKFKELLPDTGHHDALCDARWNRDVHKLITERLVAASTLPSREEVTRALETLRDICTAMAAHPPPPEKVDEMHNVMRCMMCLTGLVTNPRN